MTPERLAQILARAEATPKGQWFVEYFGDGGYPQQVSNRQAVLIAETFEGGAGLRPIPEFIAHAREDVPALVAEVERLTADLEQSRWVAKELEEHRDAYKIERDEARAALQQIIERCDHHDHGDAPYEHHWKWSEVREIAKNVLDGSGT
jgi:hypothetical protein